MIVFATSAELAQYLDPDAETPTMPDKATVLIRSASQLVIDYTAGAVYRTDADQMAVDTDTREALRDATLEQASAWSLHNIDPRLGPTQAPRRIASKGVTGVTVSYVADPAADTYLSDLALADCLTAGAYRILDNAGLISNRVRTGRGGSEQFNVTQRYYDPLTGVLDAQ